MDLAISINSKCLCQTTTAWDLEVQQLHTTVSLLQWHVTSRNAKLERLSTLNDENVRTNTEYPTTDYATVLAKNKSLQTTLNNMVGVLDELRDAIVKTENGNRSVFEAKQNEIKEMKIKHVLGKANL
jgi:hypothetical protein